MSLESGQFDISEAEGTARIGYDQKIKTIDVNRSVLTNKPLNEDLDVSEFAFTELQKKEIELTASKNIGE